MNTVLTWCGYAVPLNELSSTELHSVTKDLTLYPKSHPNYPSPPPVKAYEFNTSKKHIRVPKQYGINKFGPPKSNKQPKQSWDPGRKIIFAGSLREEQTEPFEKSLTHLQQHQHGVLCLGTSFGKTVITIALMCALKRRTLVLVHTVNLIEQWKERVQQFAPQAKVGVFHGSKKPKSEDDVVIGTYHSLCKPENIRPEDRFGFVVIDECQFVSALTFSKTFYTVNAQYTLAISATPDRVDELEQLLYLHVGPIFYQKATSTEHHHLHVKYMHISTTRKYGFHPGTQKPMQALMITELSQDQERNKKVLDIITQVGCHPTRYVLVFCERREQAHFLCDQLKQQLPHRTIGIKLGDTKRDQLQADIICSTYASVGVGVEIPKINAAVFVSPRTGRRIVEQAMSRVLRQPHPDGALLIDIVDGYLKPGATKREEVYRARMGSNITIEHVAYD